MGKPKRKKAASAPRRQSSSSGARREAEDFLRLVEEWRRSYASRRSQDAVALSPLAERLEERINAAFAGVSCHGEPRVLLGGEAADEYLSAEAEALLAPLEERDHWQRIPDDLLAACSDAPYYVGPEAYRFLLPRFMIGALHGVVPFYPRNSPDSPSIPWMREICAELDEAQRACLSDFLNLEASEMACPWRERFLPWELDEYNAAYASSISLGEYGEMLLQRFREREGIPGEPS